MGEAAYDLSALPSCPLSTSQLCDLLMQFAELYGELHGIQLHSYQRVFMRRVFECILRREGNVVTGLWSRQSGKSEAISSLAPALCILLPAIANMFPGDQRLTGFQQGFWLGIFAPKQQQATIIYERIRARAERQQTREQIYSDPEINVQVASSRGDQVSWTNGSFVTAQTASDHSNAEGKTYHLVIIDEAQIVGKAKVNKEIKPMLAHTNGVLVEIGTANALRGNFKETIIYNLEEEKKGSPRNHFEFPYDKVIAARRQTYERTKDEKHLNYEKWVTGELKRLGGNKENEEFRQNFRLMWQEAQSGAIDLDAFHGGANIALNVVYSQFHGRIVAGLDYGKKRDVTILTLMEVLPEPIVDMRAVVRGGDEQPVFYKKRILAWYEIPGRKWHDILAAVTEHLKRYAVCVLVADGTGVGDPLTETLQMLVPDLVVIPFIMSHVGNDRVFKLYIQEIEANRVEFPSSPSAQLTTEYQNFVHEHEQLIKDRVGVYTKYYAPDGEHDDHCDGAALCCYATTIDADAMASVECAENPFYGSSGARHDGSRANRYR